MREVCMIRLKDKNLAKAKKERVAVPKLKKKN